MIEMLFLSHATDWIQTLAPIAQIFVPIVLAVSAWAIRGQMILARRVNRRSQFDQSSSARQEFFDAAELHWRDHCLPAFDQFYLNNPRRRKSYLLMKQKYMYLMFHHQSMDEYERSAMMWLRELIEYREFRHVHQSHRRYYRKFSFIVDRLIQKSPIRADDQTPWFCDVATPN